MQKGPYKVLGVSRNTTLEEITNKYKSYTGYAFLEENIKNIIKNFVDEEKKKIR